ncbi:hypothetical protein [Antribacter gilvus]|uniref:hypothetical protein n=1 Tax=Antribacter gilvus TaxID=2304675 RepID=UPI000F77EDA7|nr:hypothetical protein [Antribacter gilvus]
MTRIKWLGIPVAAVLLLAGCASPYVLEDRGAAEVATEQPASEPTVVPASGAMASLDAAALIEELRGRTVVGEFHQVGSGEDPEGRPYIQYGTDQYTHSREVDPTAPGGAVVTMGVGESRSYAAKDFPPGLVVAELRTKHGVPAFGFSEDENPNFTHLEVPLGRANLLLAGTDVSIDELLAFANEVTK